MPPAPGRLAIPPANAAVASRFRRLAELLELEGANPFRVRAYRQAATAVAGLSEDVARIVARPDAQERLDALPGVGDDLAEKISEICRTGRLSLLDDVQARLPADLTALSALPGLGPFALPQVEEILSCGPSRATVRLSGGLPADLLVVPPESYGAALLHLTGSKAHNIALRRLARSRGLKLNERGLFDADRRVAGRTEGEIYAALGLTEPPPWQRETGSLPLRAP